MRLEDVFVHKAGFCWALLSKVAHDPVMPQNNLHVVPSFRTSRQDNSGKQVGKSLSVEKWPERCPGRGWGLEGGGAGSPAADAQVQRHDHEVSSCRCTGGFSVDCNAQHLSTKVSSMVHVDSVTHSAESQGKRGEEAHTESPHVLTHQEALDIPWL